MFGYENKLNVNKYKVDWLLQCILWVLRLAAVSLEIKEQKLKEQQTGSIRKLNDIEKLPS